MNKTEKLKAIALTMYCNVVTQLNRTPEISKTEMAKILREIAKTLEEEI